MCREVGPLRGPQKIYRILLPRLDPFGVIPKTQDRQTDSLTVLNYFVATKI